MSTSRRPMGDVTNSESRLARPTSISDRKRERSTRENSDANAPSQKTRKLDSTTRSSTSTRPSSTSTRPSSTSTRPSSTSTRPSSTSSSTRPSLSRPSSSTASSSARPSLRTSSSTTSSRSTTSSSRVPSSSSRTTSSRSTTSTSSRVSSSSSSRTSSSTSSRSSSSSSAAALAGSRPGKRAAWDTKGRLADLEELQKSMKQKIRDNDDRVVLLEELLKEKETAVSSLSSDKEDLKGNLEMYQTRINEETQAKQRFMFELENAKVRHASDLQEKAMRIGSLETEVQSLKVQIQVQDSENTRLRTQNTTQTMEMERNKKDFAMKETKFEADIASLKAQVEDEEQKNTEKAAKIDELEAFIAEQKEKIAELEERQRNDENLRRKLHNAIQELKGNIRVFCRVRPLSSKEKKLVEGGGGGGDQGGALCFNRADPRTLEVVSGGSTSVSGKSLPDKRHPFSFDKVFNPESTQEDVFLEISQLVQSSLDGYNTCIFAYGQTGSGKTFTMEGPNAPTEATEGMIPRTVKQIFRTAHELESLGWKYEFHCQFLEIYNESLRDLLSANQKEEKEGGAPKHEIKHSRDGVTSVTDVTVMKVESPHQVRQLLKRATKNRSVGSTQKNDRSSRSHSVFQILISGRNTISGKTAKATLSLIDLAGSERLSTSGAEGQRKKETQYINKSLSSLGDVICALANKEGHIPFRNSKLTYLLQNSLGGNSKTLMFVNVSPAVADTQESISSLRFATKVNACEIGVARRGGKINLNLD